MKFSWARAFGLFTTWTGDSLHSLRRFRTSSAKLLAVSCFSAVRVPHRGYFPILAGISALFLLENWKHFRSGGHHLSPGAGSLSTPPTERRLPAHWHPGFATEAAIVGAPYSQAPLLPQGLRGGGSHSLSSHLHSSQPLPGRWCCCWRQRLSGNRTAPGPAACSKGCWGRSLYQDNTAGIHLKGHA